MVLLSLKWCTQTVRGVPGHTSVARRRFRLTMKGMDERRELDRWVAATDGSCLGTKKRRAGWAWAVSKDPALFIAAWDAGGLGATTSYHAELMALVELLRFLPADQPVEIRMDSESVLKAATKWRHRWRANDWRRTRHGDLAQVDLIKEMDALLEGRDAEFTWVQAHLPRSDGDPLNFFVDSAARKAARTQEQRTAPGAEAGSADGDVAD